MRRSHLPERGTLAGVVVSFLFFLYPCLACARIKPVGFQIPSRMFSLGQAVTPGEYIQLKAAIRANWEREKARALQTGPGVGLDLDRIMATRIQLGALGQAMVVYFSRSPECGATGNCPMAVYVRGPKRYRRVISAGGWGDALLPSGGAVPDIVFYWNMSASESDAQLFHYANSKFMPARTAVCNGKSSSEVCAAISDNMPLSSKLNRVPSISPAEYDALRPAVEASLKRQPPALVRGASFDDAHAVGILRMQGVTVTAVGWGPCAVNRNCSISIYAHPPRGGGSWPLLDNVSGWGVSQSSFEWRAGMRFGVVIARRLSPSQDELTRYSVALSAGFGKLSPASQLSPDACEIVTPKTGHWPTWWNAAALVARPVSCFKTGPPVNAQIPAADTTNVSRVVQGSDGTSWGISSGFFDHLYRWRDGGWSNVPSPMPVSATSSQQLEYLRANRMIPLPIGLWPGLNDGVVVDWLDPITQKSELFWQRGDQAKLLVVVPPVREGAHLDIETVAPAASGIVVITRDQRGWRNGAPVSGSVQPAGIFRLDGSGQLKRIYTFALDQYLPYRSPDISSFLPLNTIRDAQGKIWIWCGWSWPGGPRGAALRGFLVTDGKTVEYHQQIPGPLGSHLTSVSVWDSHHLAAALFGGGLYTINTMTLEARAIPAPEPGAFRFVQKVFRAGKVHYVLTIGQEYGRRIPLFERPFLTGDLWRLHDGQWKEVLANIGNTFGAGLAIPKGFWLGAPNFHGLWFIPTRGPAQKIDWQQGLPLATVGKFFRLPGGDILATDAGLYGNTRSVEFHSASILARQLTPTRFSMLHPLVSMEPDRHHNLWALLADCVLGEWNGSKWIQHSLPRTIEPRRITGLDIDTRGRVWLFPDCHLGPMGYFNPVEDQWTVYGTYRTALAQLSQPVKFLHPANDPERPVYGPHSQIVFVGRCWGVNYYDGARWRLFQGRRLPPDRDIAVPPFFDSAGRLSLNIQNTTWQWRPGTDWQRTDELPPANYVPLLPNYLVSPPSPPEGCQSPAAASLVKDSLGRSWWVADDALYEGVPGHCRKVLSGSARQPFIDGRRLVSVQLDPRGNAFLKTNLPFAYIMLSRISYAGEIPSASQRF